MDNDLFTVKVKIMSSLISLVCVDHINKPSSATWFEINRSNRALIYDHRSDLIYSWFIGYIRNDPSFFFTTFLYIVWNNSVHVEHEHVIILLRLFIKLNLPMQTTWCKINIFSYNFKDLKYRNMRQCENNAYTKKLQFYCVVA